MCKDSSPMSMSSSRNTIMAPNVSEQQPLGALSHTAQRGSSHLFCTFNVRGFASWAGEGAEPSAGRWNGVFCQTCCTGHNGSPREPSFTPHSSQICAGNKEEPWFSCAARVGGKSSKRENSTMKDVWEGWGRELRKPGKYHQLTLQRLPKIVSIWVRANISGSLPGSPLQTSNQ